MFGPWDEKSAMTGAGLMPMIVFPLITKPDGTLAQTHPAQINSSFFCGKERKNLPFLIKFCATS